MEEKDRREEPEKLSRSEEEKIERTLRDMTEDIEVPESLKPEAVEQMLAGNGPFREEADQVAVRSRRCRGMYLFCSGTCRSIWCVLSGKGRRRAVRPGGDSRNRRSIAAG